MPQARINNNNININIIIIIIITKSHKSKLSALFIMSSCRIDSTKPTPSPCLQRSQHSNTLLILILILTVMSYAPTMLYQANRCCWRMSVRLSVCPHIKKRKNTDEKLTQLGTNMCYGDVQKSGNI